MHFFRQYVGVVIFFFIAIRCDQGLAPESTSSVISRHGIRGFVYFKHWPPVDSVIDLRLAALKDSPSANIVNDVLQRRAQFTEKLVPYGADSITYTLLLSPLSPGRFSYIGVAQQYGSNILSDWRIVGVFHPSGDTTMNGFVDVPIDSIVGGVNIYVDFLHLPPQP